MAKYDFIEVVSADEGIVGADRPGFWAVVEGFNGVDEIIDDCFDTEEEAMIAGKGFKEEMRICVAESQQEAAYQAGMGMGCDAYNDVMFG